MLQMIKENNDVIKALQALSECAEAAAQTQKLYESVKRWEPQLLYLIGQRTSVRLKPDGFKFGQHYNEAEKRNEVRLKSVHSGFETIIEGDVHEFQRIACEILSAFPIVPNKDVSK